MEAGRQVLVRLGPDGMGIDLTPAPFSVRTRVHEYGGGAALATGGSVYFSNFADQRLYRIDGDSAAVALTPPSDGAALRHADGLLDTRRQLWIGVREDHRAAGTEAINSIVAVDLGRSGAANVLVQGNDFYAAPRLSPDGTRLAWLTWNHPDMPWSAAQLWIGDFDGVAVTHAAHVAGGPGESVFQPDRSDT